MDDQACRRARRGWMPALAVCPLPEVARLVLLGAFRAACRLRRMEAPVSATLHPGARAKLSSLGARLPAAGGVDSCVGAPAIGLA